MGTGFARSRKRSDRRGAYDAPMFRYASIPRAAGRDRSGRVGTHRRSVASLWPAAPARPVLAASVPAASLLGANALAATASATVALKSDRPAPLLPSQR